MALLRWRSWFYYWLLTDKTCIVCRLKNQGIVGPNISSIVLDTWIKMLDTEKVRITEIFHHQLRNQSCLIILNPFFKTGLTTKDGTSKTTVLQFIESSFLQSWLHTAVRLLMSMLFYFNYTIRTLYLSQNTKFIRWSLFLRTWKGL